MTIWVENENKCATEQTIHEKETEIGLILPTDYKQLLLKQNGGLIRKNHFPTSEPTSYGLDFGEIYYLGSLDELLTDIPEQKDVELAGKQVYFHRDESRYLGFSYMDNTSEPSIIYVDFETLQTLVVAENLAAFLEKLYFSPFPIDLAEHFPIKKLNQILAASNVQKTKQLLELLEDYPDKKWYLETLLGLLEKQEIPYNLVVCSLFENQLLYFRRKLVPELVEQIFVRLKACDGINKVTVAELYKEWN
ncbi:SMI1/KNR4 family protein [Listeria monocytogenes]|uniref:SMI1 / KNR4 family protein n=2 Tax=Listeria monocytogenes TaxID=1639 RepID=A0A3T2FGG5_LISMN|nr:SMI1/KNR4 family protein [Listeria monocytogenes]EAA0164846.1 SMI1 / KNR4 family protein [Listeria monocytogenes serotype 1/2a]EAF4503043.1 SMI1 / KNR4 family protein [Listeria monocytogenes serotype 4b]EAG6270269.1 SMI1 / KNR4 family protein [Listeria monocytogenes CFSAN003726]EAG6273485.1 SMI1 / KNR4 family protein [Listeria monocytogenes CFSAN003808]EAG6279693.1 SMI1 / KNR4 family protein [Listeria monocytogenes CFSAN003809]EAG6358388.1 SMI1 / KNR4 family protein [Listeria monocytogenes